MGVNIVIQQGNLTRDPELNTLPSGDSVVNFSIAVNEYYSDRNGQQQQITDYIDCKAYGGKADTINKYFSKGRPILVEGSLRQERWQDNNGQNRSKLVVKVKDFQFVDSKNDSNGNSTSGSGNTQKPYSVSDAEAASDALEIDGVTV